MKKSDVAAILTKDYRGCTKEEILEEHRKLAKLTLRVIDRANAAEAELQECDNAVKEAFRINGLSEEDVTDSEGRHIRVSQSIQGLTTADSRRR